MRFWDKLLELLGLRPAPQPIPVRPRGRRCRMMAALMTSGLVIGSSQAFAQQIERDLYWAIPPQGASQEPERGTQEYIWHGAGLDYGTDRYTTAQPGVYDVHPGYWGSGYNERTEASAATPPRRAFGSSRHATDYQYNRQVQGRIDHFEAITGVAGSPARVVAAIQTNGRLQYVHLADLSFGPQALPTMRVGQPITLAGSWYDIDRQRVFHARRYGPSDRAVPEYRYPKRLSGTLTQIPLVVLQQGEVVAAVGTIRLDDGRMIKAVFGDLAAVHNPRLTKISPGTSVAIEGFVRSAGSQSQFFAQHVFTRTR